VRASEIYREHAGSRWVHKTLQIILMQMQKRQALWWGLESSPHAPISQISVSLSLSRYHHISHNKINSADQSKSFLTGKAGLVDSSDSQMRLKDMSHTDLFLTMCLRPKVYAEVIIRGGLPIMRALCCLLGDGEWFMVRGPGAQCSPRAGCPAHLPDTELQGEKNTLRGKESLETGRFETKEGR